MDSRDYKRYYALLQFAKLMSLFCAQDSAGHMQYIKNQADNALTQADEVQAIEPPDERVPRIDVRALDGAPKMLEALRRIASIHEVHTGWAHDIARSTLIDLHLDEEEQEPPRA